MPTHKPLETGDNVIPFFDYAAGEWVNYHGHIVHMTLAQARRFIPQRETLQADLTDRVNRLRQLPGVAVLDILQDFNPPLPTK